jgi:HAD superfamily hydrolase (TIGR01490 family)
MQKSMLQPKYYAFFDVDGTLLNIKSTHNFLYFFYKVQYRSSLIASIKYFTYSFKVKIYEMFNVERETLNRLYYENFKGINKSKLQILSVAWFENIIRDGNVFIRSCLQELEYHKKQGAEIVLVSGSFEECLAPLAEHLQIKTILATKLEENQGVCSGKISGQQMIGNGKANAIYVYLTDKNYSDFSKCYAYGDHISDASMLTLVGKPCVIKGDPDLIAYAKKNNWRLLSKN